MDARMLLGGLSVGLAFASAALLASGARSAAPRRRDAGKSARRAAAEHHGTSLLNAACPAQQHATSAIGLHQVVGTHLGRQASGHL